MDKIIESLLNVSWENIQGVEGNCSFLREKIEDEKLDAESFWNFEFELYTQRELFEGSFYILPFLFKILENAELSNAKSAYNSIYEILSSVSTKNKNVCYSSIAEPFEYYIPAKQGTALPLVVACRNYISSRFIFLLKQVELVDLSILADVLDIIISFLEYDHLVVTSLIELHSLANSEERKELIKAYLLDFVKDTDFYDTQYILNSISPAGPSTK